MSKTQISDNYNENRNQLQNIVAELEKNTGDIEQSLKLWKQANELTVWCKKFLDDAKSHVGAVIEGDIKNTK